MTDPGLATRLLRRIRAGDDSAADELAPLVHDELHRLARGAMARARPGHTLQPTALLNEAWMKLIDLDTDWEGRSHFMGVAARAMRSVLIDYARRAAADKRGGDRERVEMRETLLLFEERAVDLIVLEQALEELTAMDPSLARIVELRFFGGLENKEIAHVTGASLRTVERGWATARTWLFQRITEELGK